MPIYHWKFEWFSLNLGKDVIFISDLQSSNFHSQPGQTGIDYSIDNIQSFEDGENISIQFF